METAGVPVMEAETVGVPVIDTAPVIEDVPIRETEPVTVCTPLKETGTVWSEAIATEKLFSFVS